MGESGSRRSTEMVRRSWWRGTGTGVVIAAVLSVSMVAGCTAGPTSSQFHATPATTTPAPTTPAPTASPKYAGPSALAITPVAGTAGVSPADAVSATLTAGTLTTVSLVGADGRPVAGSIHTD